MGEPCWGGGTCPAAAVTPTFPWVWSDTQTQTGCPRPPARGASAPGPQPGGRLSNPQPKDLP